MPWILIGIVVSYAAVTVFTFALLKVASDADDRMELEEHTDIN